MRVHVQAALVVLLAARAGGLRLHFIRGRLCGVHRRVVPLPLLCRLLLGHRVTDDAGRPNVLLALDHVSRRLFDLRVVVRVRRARVQALLSELGVALFAREAALVVIHLQAPRAVSSSSFVYPDGVAVVPVEALLAGSVLLN